MDDRITYGPAQPEDVEPLRQFMLSVGKRSRAEDSERFQAVVARADRTVVARDGDRIVGFARALCDGVSNGYLSMVIVAPEERGKGIGRHMVETIIGDDSRVTWVLRASAESVGFWNSLGFKDSDMAMERVRTI